MAEADFLAVFGHSASEHGSVVDAHGVTTVLALMYVCFSHNGRGESGGRVRAGTWRGA